MYPEGFNNAEILWLSETFVHTLFCKTSKWDRDI